MEWNVKYQNKMKYQLPKLDYEYDELEPHISKEVLKIHHTKHHQVYVDNSNKILKKLEDARNKNDDLDLKHLLKSLSFNVGGHILHSIFWKTISSNNSEEPKGKLLEKINNDFGSFSRFKEEFSNVANSVEGSGWAALTYCNETDKLILMQIEKHNVNICPGIKILMVLDVWEHAYYLDYKNKRNKFVEAFWKIVNWKKVEKRLND